MESKFQHYIIWIYDFPSPFIKNAVFSPVCVFGAFVRPEPAANMLAVFLTLHSALLVSVFLCRWPDVLITITC